MTRFSDSSKGPDREEGPLVLLAGPTAAGKTSLSVQIAARVPVEIVNADSMQVYRFMDVGTAKPAPRERSAVPHHLIDVADPDEPFDAARYQELAGPVSEGIRKRGRIPLVVGGTGLYMKALTRGLCEAPPSDPEVRKKILSEEKSIGLSGLYRKLCLIDPAAASKIHPNDRQRILRAVEVFEITGVPLSRMQEDHGFRERVFRAVKVFVTRPREVLYERIDRRVDRMIEAGLKDEVERLIAMGYSPGLKSMQSLGYRQMAAHIAGDLTFEKAVFLIKRDTRRYAKRQITWFRGDPEFVAFDAEDAEGICHHIETQLAGEKQRAHGEN